MSPHTRMEPQAVLPAPVSRRTLLKLLAGASGGALCGAVSRVSAALAAAPRPPALVWFSRGTAEHHLLPLLGGQWPDFMRLIHLNWNISSWEAVEPLGGSGNSKELPDAPLLVLEALPAEDTYIANVPLNTWLERARAVLFVGSAACYGTLGESPTALHQLETRCHALQLPWIKLPGLPVPPHHLIGVIAQLEFYGMPALDAQQRPLDYYGQTVCAACERRGDLEIGRFAQTWGEAGCMLQLGCKGPWTYNSCPVARWNGGASWCVGAGGICTGCSEASYPDHAGMGLYGRAADDALAPRLGLWQALPRLGGWIFALAGMGVLLRVAAALWGRAASPDTRRENP